VYSLVCTTICQNNKLTESRLKLCERGLMLRISTDGRSPILS
jgi:hypothetical protein